MNTVYLVANGDLRLAANQMCEPAQAAMEKALVAAIQKEEFFLKRAHPFDEKKRHGFIDSQKAGTQIFHSIPKEAPVVVAESVWQYSQHILPGLFAHKGPILTVANWSGTWPGRITEPQRVPKKGGDQIQQPLERRFQRQIFCEEASPVVDER